MICLMKIHILLLLLVSLAVGAPLTAAGSDAGLREYNVLYISYGSSGSRTVKAASATDAKAMVEAGGATVYRVKGQEGTIDFMSYSEAIEIQRNR
jgi:hypothetical protein